MPVQKVVRIGVAALAVGLVGYAVLVASRPDPKQAPAAGEASPRTPRARATGDKGKTGSASAGRRLSDDASKSAAGAREAAAPPSPTPIAPVVYETTLVEFQGFVSELESLDARKQTLVHEEWVERYRRGSELGDALMRTPDAKDADRNKAILELNMRFRNVIHKLVRPR